MRASHILGWDSFRRSTYIFGVLEAAQLLSDFQPGLVRSLLNKLLLHFSLVAVGMDSIEVRDGIGFKKKGAGPVT